MPVACGKFCRCGHRARSTTALKSEGVLGVLFPSSLSAKWTRGQPASALDARRVRAAQRRNQACSSRRGASKEARCGVQPLEREEPQQPRRTARKPLLDEVLKDVLRPKGDRRRRRGRSRFKRSVTEVMSNVIRALSAENRPVRACGGEAEDADRPRRPGLRAVRRCWRFDEKKAFAGSYPRRQAHRNARLENSLLSIRAVRDAVSISPLLASVGQETPMQTAAGPCSSP